MNEDKIILISEIQRRIDFIDKCSIEDIEKIKDITSKPYNEILIDSNITELYNIINEIRTMLYCRYILKDKILKNGSQN